MYKGIESPYKSVLKLLLTEVYASEHPRVHCLSLRFKQAVFANRLDLDELDPYVVVYRRIEEYLIARNEPERLELVRRALYLKVNRKLTGNSRTQSWQRSLLNAWPMNGTGTSANWPCSTAAASGKSARSAPSGGHWSTS